MRTASVRIARSRRLSLVIPLLTAIACSNGSPVASVTAVATPIVASDPGFNIGSLDRSGHRLPHFDTERWSALFDIDVASVAPGFYSLICLPIPPEPRFGDLWQLSSVSATRTYVPIRDIQADRRGQPSANDVVYYHLVFAGRQ